MGQSKVSLSQIEGGDKLKEVLSWFQKIKDAGFSERFEALWEETRRAAKKSGYSSADVDRLIAEVRKGNARS